MTGWFGPGLALTWWHIIAILAVAVAIWGSEILYFEVLR
jgi:hypothetical protein